MAIVEIIRALVRPTLTLFGGISLLILTIQGQPIPEWLTTSWAMMVAWWFADRARRGNNGGK